MQTLNVDDLRKDIQSILGESAGRVRSGAASGALWDLILWNILIATFVHIGASVFAHGVGENSALDAVLTRLRRALSEFRNSRLSAKQASTTELTDTAKGALVKIVERMASMGQLSEPSRLDVAKVLATKDVQTILKETTEWPEERIVTTAQRIVNSIVDRLSSAFL